MMRRVALAMPGHAVALRCGAVAAPAGVAPRRWRGTWKVWSDEDPEVHLEWARESAAKLTTRGLQYNRDHLMQLTSVAIAHYRKQDFPMAYKCALYALAKTQEHRPKGDSLIFHAAVTAKKCAEALADAYEAHQAGSLKLGPGGFRAAEGGALKEDIRKSVMTPQRVVAQLRREADEHHRLAQHVFWLPRNFWMRNRRDEDRRDAPSAEEAAGPFEHEPTGSEGRRDRRTADGRKRHAERRWRNTNDLRRASLKEAQTPLQRYRRPVPR